MTGLTDFTLRDIVAILAAAGIIGGMVIAWVRWQLAGTFAGKVDIEHLSQRLEQVEQQMRTAPTDGDLHQLSTRLAAVETGVAVTGAQMVGVKEAVSRIERDVSLVVQQLIRVC